MNLKPLRGKVIVQNISNEKNTDGGIIIADSVREVPHKGKVLAIGSKFLDKKCREKDWHFSVGETVYYLRQWTQPAQVYILLRDDIYAVEGEGGIRAVSDRVIVKRVYTDKIADGVIVVPDQFGTKQNHGDFHGVVVAEGPESHFNFNIGDRILYSRDEGSRFEFNGQEYFSLRPRAVLAMAETTS